MNYIIQSYKLRSIEITIKIFIKLHQIILTKVSKELGEVGIFELFDIIPVELIDEEIDDMGCIEYIIGS